MKLILGVILAAGVIWSGAYHLAAQDIHLYGHLNNGVLHCTAYFDHEPVVDEFHFCNNICQTSATVVVLD